MKLRYPYLISHGVLWECDASPHRFRLHHHFPKRREDAHALRKSGRLPDQMIMASARGWQVRLHPPTEMS